MAIAAFDIPKKNAVVFTFTDLWMPEAEHRFTWWRNADSGNEDDVKLFGGAPKSGQTYSTNAYINVDHRVITRRPRYSKKIEKYFGQAMIDSFRLEIYDTPFDDDIVSVQSSGNKTLTLAQNPYDRLFSRYIKPDRTTRVFCKWEIKKNGSATWKLRGVGEIQNAIEGGDVRWTKPKKDNPYLTRSYGTNKESDRETIWSVTFGNVAQVALGKTPARPTTNPNSTESWYMPFFNSTPTAAAIAKGAVSALPYMDTFPNVPPGSKVVPVVDDFRYTDTTAQARRALWRRHISMGQVCKAWFDFAFGANSPGAEDSYRFVCEDSRMEFLGAYLKTPQTMPANVGVFVTPYRTELEVFPLDASGNPQWRKVNAHWNIELERTQLMPQCLWGLYDEIDCAAGDPIPLPQEHYGNKHESAWETLLEWCYCYGWEPDIRTAYQPKPHEPKVIVTFRAKKKNSTSRKFTFIMPKDAKPTQFPESESGISVERRVTFRNALDSDGEFDDWNSYKGDGKTPGITYKERTLNPRVAPVGAANPATMKISLTLGADNSGAFISGLAVNSPRIHWYSTGYPSVSNPHDAECERTERFPMFSPLVYSDNPLALPILALEVQGGFGKLFRPVILARFRDEEKGVYYNYGTWRGLLANFYASYFVRAEKEYKISVPTCTEFTSADNIADKKGTDFDMKDIYFLADIFEDEYFLHAYEEDWEAITTDLKLFRTRSLQNVNILVDDDGGTPVDHYFGGVPNVTTVNNTTGTLRGTITISAVGTPSSELKKAEMRVGVALFAEMNMNIEGLYYQDLDTLLYPNGTHTLDVKVTDMDGNTATKSTEITIAN